VAACSVASASGKLDNPADCSAAMAKTTLPAAYQQKVLAGDPNAELHTYNQALPLMMVRYLGPGLLGLGITALIAGFMSGMAGNVSAFSTVWTYDIYKPLINKKGSDSHYVLVGRLSILFGVIVSIGAAYLVQQFHGIMDYVQALFSIFVAPLLAAILFGMFWKRATALAGFLGLLLGIVFSASLFLWVKLNPAALATVALSPDAKPMAENVFRALVGIRLFRDCDYRGEPAHQAQAGGGTGRAGLRRDRSSQGRAGAVLQKRVAVGDPGGVHLCGAQHSVLVTRDCAAGGEHASVATKGKGKKTCMVPEFKSGFSLECCC
jgi:hypothetical protein